MSMAEGGKIGDEILLLFRQLIEITTSKSRKRKLEIDHDLPLCSIRVFNIDGLVKS
jgi:hypothetical protein